MANYSDADRCANNKVSLVPTCDLKTMIDSIDFSSFSSLLFCSTYTKTEFDDFFYHIIVAFKAYKKTHERALSTL